MKKFLFVLLMLAVIAVAVLFVFAEKLDGIVKNQIEEIGTETLGQAVSVGGVNIELKSGMGEITGLRIANPAGFSDSEAFVMDRIRLNIDLTSVSHNPLILDEFILEAPVVSLEIRKDGSSNLDEIIAHLRARQSEKTGQPAETKPESEKEPLRFVIRKLKIAGVQLTLRHPKFGEEAKELVLPDIDVGNIGTDNGVSPAKLGEIVVESIAKEGARQAVRAEVEKQASRLLDKAGSSLLKKLEGTKTPEAE